MKWVLVFFISITPETDDVTLYGFPNLPFDSKQECQTLVRTYYPLLQAKVNYEYNTQGVEYPALCITQQQFYEAAGYPS